MIVRTNKLRSNAEESGASKLHMVKVEVNKETAWQNRLFLVGKIANPALSFVRLLASAICNQEPVEGPKMWLGFDLIDIAQNF